MYDFFTHVPRLLARAKVVLVLRDVPGSIFGLEAKEALLSANWIGPSTSSHLSFSRLVKVGGVDRRAAYGLRLHVAVAAGDESLSLRGCGGAAAVSCCAATSVL